MFDFGLIDAHCHLANTKLADFNLKKHLEIKGIISCAMTPKDALWHKKQINDKMNWVAGIHPLYKLEDSFSFDELEQLIKEKAIIGIGEIGLDSRGDDMQYQRDILLPQLALARDYDLPVVFHVVKEYYTLLKLLKNNFPKTRGFFHSFHSSKQIVQEYNKLPIAFSLNCRSTKVEVINEITQTGKLLLETDAPCQKPLDSTDEFNSPANINLSLQQVSEISGLTRDELVKKQYDCYQQIFC